MRRPVANGALAANQNQPPPNAPPPQSFLGTAAQAPTPHAAAVAGGSIIDPNAKWQLIKQGIEGGWIQNNPQDDVPTQWMALINAVPNEWFKAPFPKIQSGTAAPPAQSGGPLDFSGAVAQPGTLYGTDLRQGAPGTQPFMGIPGAGNEVATAGRPAATPTAEAPLDFSNVGGAATQPTPPVAVATPQAVHVPTPPAQPQPQHDAMLDVAQHGVLGNVVETLMRIDVAATMRHVIAALEPADRSDRVLTRHALDASNAVTGKALLLVLKAREELARVKHEIDQGKGGMRAEAMKAVSADLEAGGLKGKKTITNEDVNAKMRELYPDEYVAQEARLEKAKGVVEYCEDLHKRAAMKQTEIRSIYDHFPPG